MAATPIGMRWDLELHNQRWAIRDASAPFTEFEWFAKSDQYWTAKRDRHLFRSLKSARRKRATLRKVWRQSDLRIVRVMA